MAPNLNVLFLMNDSIAERIPHQLFQHLGLSHKDVISQSLCDLKIKFFQTLCTP